MKLGFTLFFSLLANIAWAGTPFIGFDVGAGDLDINNVQISPDFDLGLGSNDNTLVANLNAGYEFANGLVVTGATESTGQISFLGLGDSVEVDAYKFGLGFGRTVAQRFRVHGTIGVAFWELEARESFFLNPGPEATGSIDGNDLYFDVGAEYLFTDALSLVLLYNYNDYDFGNATAARIGVRFRFQKD